MAVVVSHSSVILLSTVVDQACVAQRWVPLKLIPESSMFGIALMTLWLDFPSVQCQTLARASRVGGFA